ncbi:MAG: molybdenum cofactor guanylyltransferase MobA [Candidatus Competibacteraceae bacterium]|nr:molybdenum cofactor guanylyltransferase MobA [Candidatus Competibacteraceae bacterium]
MTDYPRQQITAVVLAGGRATRMGGQDKGLITLAGRPLVHHALAALAPQVGQVLINANRNRERYQALGYPVVADSVGDYDGPLAGMLAALETMAGDWLLTAPCDSPLIPPDYAERMWTARALADAELVVARDQRRQQPVFLLLSRNLDHSLRDYLLAGERKIDRWFARHRLGEADFSDQAGMFRNINTPEELAVLERELKT